MKYLKYYNLNYYSESMLMAVALLDSTKMNLQQHNFAFPSVTSPGILGPGLISIILRDPLIDWKSAVHYWKLPWTPCTRLDG